MLRGQGAVRYGCSISSGLPWPRSTELWQQPPSQEMCMQISLTLVGQVQCCTVHVGLQTLHLLCHLAMRFRLLAAMPLLPCPHCHAAAHTPHALVSTHTSSNTPRPLTLLFFAFPGGGWGVSFLRSCPSSLSSLALTSWTRYRRFTTY